MVSQKWGCKNLFAVLKVNRTWNYTIQYGMLWVELVCTSHAQYSVRNTQCFTVHIHFWRNVETRLCLLSLLLCRWRRRVYTIRFHICRTIGEKVELDCFIEYINIFPIDQFVFISVFFATDCQSLCKSNYHLSFNIFLGNWTKKKNCAQRNSSLFIFFFCIPIIRMFTCYYRANTQSIHIFHLTINEMKIQNVPITLCALFFRLFWNSRAVFHSINGQF